MNKMRLLVCYSGLCLGIRPLGPTWDPQVLRGTAEKFFSMEAVGATYDAVYRSVLG